MLNFKNLIVFKDLQSSVSFRTELKAICEQGL